MKFACRIKLSGSGLYLGDDLKECAKDAAPIIRREAAEARARQRFGKDWQSMAVIEEVPYEEWMGHISRKKAGRPLSEAQIEALKKLHKARCGKFRTWKVRVHGHLFCVNARTAGEACELIGRHGKSLHENHFWKVAVQLKNKPDAMRNRSLNRPVALVRELNGKWRLVK